MSRTLPSWQTAAAASMSGSLLSFLLFWLEKSKNNLVDRVYTFFEVPGPVVVHLCLIQRRKKKKKKNAILSRAAFIGKFGSDHFIACAKAVVRMLKVRFYKLI